MYRVPKAILMNYYTTLDVVGVSMTATRGQHLLARGLSDVHATGVVTPPPTRVTATHGWGRAGIGERQTALVAVGGTYDGGANINDE